MGVVNAHQRAQWNGSRPEEGTAPAADGPVVVFGGSPELEVHDGLRQLPGAAAGNRVALTFDDGPDRWTDDLLDVLQKNAVNATFFVVGEKIIGHQQEVRHIHGLGHEVANHTYSHANLSDLSNEEVLRELADCSTEIHRAIGSAPYFYRAPFLNDPPAAKMAGLALGMLSVGCDVIAEDWHLTDWREITNNVTSGVKAGGRIVLMHDGVPSDRKGDRAATVKAVKAIVPWLKDHGYELVTVSELLGRVDVWAA